MSRYFKFVFLIISLLLINCSDQHKIERSTQLYHLAKALSLKFEALHPDSNFVLISTTDCDVTNRELLHSLLSKEGAKIQRLRLLNPVALKERIYQNAEAMIITKLLLKRAKQHKISISNTAFDSVFQAEIKQFGSEKEFLEDLNKKGISAEAVKGGIKDRMVMEKYLAEKLRDEITVSDEEIREEYEKGKIASFRHILLSTEGKSEIQKKKIKSKLQKILKRAKSGEDFSDLAKKYSEDKGSRVKGGLYQDMERGALDSAFAEVVFSIEIGAISDIVESVFGYHIIKVLDRKKDAISLDEMKLGIINKLKAQKLLDASAKYIDKMKEDVNFTIINY